MDYNYIKQLLERYWQCETSLEEENILRTFFSQKEVPVELLPYKDLFTYEQSEVRNDTLGDDFDERIMAIINEPENVKAKKISLTERLKPLFKAAAIVAIFLTLGNAMQVPFNQNEANIATNEDANAAQGGSSVAVIDSMTIDSLKQSNVVKKQDVQTNTIGNDAIVEEIKVE